MATKIEICNFALSHLGQNRRISALTDANENARQCNQFYDLARESVLSEHNWKFATKEQALVAYSSETIIGWSNLYVKPAKCLLVSRVYNEGTQAEKSEDYVQKMTTSNQNVICTNIEDAYIEFVTSIEDTTVFSPKFIEALSLKLAMFIAEPLTGNAQKMQQIAQVYEVSLDKAKYGNAMQASHIIEVNSSYYNAR